METTEVAGFASKYIDMALEFAPTVALAILTLIIGSWIIKKMVKLVNKGITSSGLDTTLANFLSSIINAH